MASEASLTLETVAARLGVSRTTVRRMIDDGTLPAVKAGPRSLRVPFDAVERFIEANTPTRAVEMPCACRHAFSEHRRASSLTLFDTVVFTGAGLGLAMQAAAERAECDGKTIRHTHACMRCDCSAWEGLYQHCLQCGAPLSETDACKVQTIARPWRTRWVPIVRSICGSQTWREAIPDKDRWIAIERPLGTPLDLPPKDAQMMAEVIAEAEAEESHG